MFIESYMLKLTFVLQPGFATPGSKVPANPVPSGKFWHKYNNRSSFRKLYYAGEQTLRAARAASAGPSDTESSASPAPREGRRSRDSRRRLQFRKEISKNVEFNVKGTYYFFYRACIKLIFVPSIIRISFYG